MKDEILESMNAKADAMRKQIVDILGDTIGIIVKNRYKQINSKLKVFFIRGVW